MKNHSLKQVANVLNISRSTVQRLCKSGGLKSFKIAGRRLVDDNDLDEFVRYCQTASYRMEHPNSVPRRILTTIQLDIVDDQFGRSGGEYCFCARIGGLGVAILNESGYNPLPFDWYKEDDYSIATDDAQTLNREFLKMSERGSMMIVASTMREVKS